MYLFTFALILIVSKIFGEFSNRLNQPEVLGEILAGIILGPSILKIITYSEILESFSEIGIIFVLFLAGMETDFEQLKRAGKSSILAAVVGIIFSFTGGYFLAIFFNFNSLEALFLGAILTPTSIGITVRTLMEIKKFKTDEGMTMMGAAVLDDILGVLILSLLVTIGKSGHIPSPLHLFILLGKILIFFIISIYLGPKLLENILEWSKYLRSQEAKIGVLIAIAFIFSFIAGEIDLARITGAYLAGLLVAMTSSTTKVKDSISTIGYSIFIPMFFVSIGIRMNLTGIQNVLIFSFSYTIIAFLTKVTGSGIGALLSGYSKFDSLKVGIGMLPRMEVALVIVSAGVSENVISKSLFTSTIVMVLITTIITPILLKRTYQIS